ncbi:DNA-directed RNA polymerase [Striga asiatica]|uniref:DNA-directed RNA polymerase subunit n=1 Tax=Striga asiatica TaxID=4170 RepID=A0A5A7P779_STRAF|nr:DNA-directed RNA polymerase [Striga asiatica]
MESSSSFTALEAEIKGISFSLATRQEICKASGSQCPISHATQLFSNPFLGLPLETGKCETCGTGEAGQCEGHFGYIELPTPIYHPDHVSELKRMLSFLCLKCLKLKFKIRKVNSSGGGFGEIATSCCPHSMPLNTVVIYWKLVKEISQVSINENKTTDGACYLELKVPARSTLDGGFWSFLEKYGFRYGNTQMHSRPLLPSEVMAILKKIPNDTRKKLTAKGYFPQEGYIIQYLPVPPNCLSVPDISDGISTMSTDYSIALLKKVLRVVEIIKTSRSGTPNFESQQIESNELQAAVTQYLQFRGTGKASRDVDTRFGVKKEENVSSTKAWLEKMKTLFIRKGSGFSSRSVITGDPFKGVSEIGLPFEIAQKITFEERVNQHNMEFLQKLVDKNMCLAYRDGMSTYSLREGSKGHTFLRPGQVVHRRIMDGDIVFINRPPTTHKHSLQALSVYVHEDHTVKINPLICGPLSADFDGDCIHLFYPQSLEAKAEVVELFSVEKQLLSSHTGNFILQLGVDSLLSLKVLFRKCFLSRVAAQQLAMFVPSVLSKPSVVKSGSGPLWTASQILQMTLPPSFDCSGERHRISNSEVLTLDFNRDVMTPITNDLVTSLFFLKGPREVLRFFDSVQPLLMESLYSEGFSVSLRDFYLPRDVLESIQENIQKISPLLYHLRSCYSESVALQLDSYLRSVKIPATNFIVKSSRIGHLIDSKSESALNKVVQQIGFLGTQLSHKGKFYSEILVKEMSSLFQKKYPSFDDYPAEEFGLVGRNLFRGLDPYQEMVHSISSREVIVRSSRGLTEPGTLFKNLMAILRDVVICYDGTVRNTCSNSIIQFEYGVNSANIASEFCAGDPVGVLAATAMSNPAYKAVLDSSASSNSSWEMMKEILLCGVNFKNDISDRRVMLYLNNCDCGRKHCQESAALIVKNHLKKVSLKDTAIELLIEYRSEMMHEIPEVNPGPVGHIHLNKTQLVQSNLGMHEIFEKCEDTISLHQKKKKVGALFQNMDLSFSECCSFCQSSKSKWTDAPCIQFRWREAKYDVDKASQLLADVVIPVLFDTIIKGGFLPPFVSDQRISSANVVWLSSDTASWTRSPTKREKGELALDVILEKDAVKKIGDAWRVLMDSCLPIMHLIDTRRSVPCAIKQVQELLGISCAFEQAVQRLSTSVTMVTKGVLKDHLLLLANSMTCAGTFIGFNTGGIKTLSRSLDVQVPFMNATLFTPRKCFERAAEKRHVDNLSSIVASCAWGKHVTVGTGSPFEILWDTRKAELEPNKEIDAYNFLHLVNSRSNPEDIGTSCLGEEIEDLDQDYMESELSPVREDGLDKPTFEDGFELGPNGDDRDGFSKDFTCMYSTHFHHGISVLLFHLDLVMIVCFQSASQDSWLSLTKMVESQEDGWGKKPEQSAWGKNVISEETQDDSVWGRKTDSGGGSWGKKTEESTWGAKVNFESEQMGEKSTQDEDTQNTSWGKKVDSEGDGWKKNPEQSTWGRKADSSVSDWNTTDKQSKNGVALAKKADFDGRGWAKNDEQNKWGGASSIEPRSQSSWAPPSAAGKDWGQKDDQGTLANAGETYSGGWGKKPEESTWGQKSNSKKADSAGGNWAKKEDHNMPQSQSSWGVTSGGKEWGQKESKMSEADELGAGAGWTKTNEQNSWGQVSTPKTDNNSTWGKGKDDAKTDKFLSAGSQDGGGSWSLPPVVEKETPQQDASAWAPRVESPKGIQWGAKPVADNTPDSKPSGNWGSSNDWAKFDKQSPTKEAPSNTWGSSPQPNDSTAGGWGSSKADADGDRDARPQWGRGRGRGRGRGWGRGGRFGDGSQGRGGQFNNNKNDGEWKNRRPRPNDDPNVLATLTAMGQRLDSFTAEEQDVLSEIESVMKNIRRVMHQTGYNDGDPISADDQKYIIDNVLNYHPDKAVKMGAGVNHIMVSRHGEFQDSRCFYVVSVDGGKEDFSYRKCLESFIREKYPDKAETFIPKYFKKLPPRTGFNRDRGPPPSWNRDNTNTPAPDEVGTPGWAESPKGTGNSSGWGGTPGGTGNLGWEKDQTTPNPDAAATGGWNRDNTPAPDEVRTPGWAESPKGTGNSSGWGGNLGWDKDQPTPNPDAAATGGWEKAD